MSDADQPETPDTPIIYPDADEHNANWLRLLAQRRKEQQDEQQQKEQPTNG